MVEKEGRVARNIIVCRKTKLCSSMTVENKEEARKASVSLSRQKTALYTGGEKLFNASTPTTIWDRSERSLTVLKKLGETAKLDRSNRKFSLFEKVEILIVTELILPMGGKGAYFYIFRIKILPVHSS